MLFRDCGENLPAVLRGDVDPLNLMFPDGALTTAEHLYQDSPTLRLEQSAGAEGDRSRSFDACRKGKALRVLEIGGGTGGMTSFVLPVLPEHCTEYVFTDVSPRFIPHAQQKFAQYPFVQCRMLDIERDPLEQGFDAHSFDLIVASDVLHATKDLRQTLDRVKQLLGSGGTLVLLEMTRPWLGSDSDLRIAQRLVAVRGSRSPTGRALPVTRSNGRACCARRASAARSASPTARTPTSLSTR